MNTVAAASIVAGILSGVWLVGLAREWLPSHGGAVGGVGGPTDGHSSSGAPAPRGLSQYQARSKLDSMGIAYSDEEFVYMAAKGDAGVVGLFLEAGMKENPDACKRALIEGASANATADVISALIRDCANLTRDDRTQALLRAAGSSGHSQAVAPLLRAGADPNATYPSETLGGMAGKSALWAAVNCADDQDTVRALVQGGAMAKGT